MQFRAILPLLVLGMGTAWAPCAAADVTAMAPAPVIARFRQVDTALYRGGQPDAAAFRQLKELGIKTVVNLRRNDEERQVVEALGLRYVDLSTGLTPFGLSGGIKADVVRQFFEVVDDPRSGPVFVHCRRGADRTGVLIAMYRVARQGWTAKAAYEEARTIGMRWWHYPVKGQLEAFASQHETLVRRPALAPTSRP
jgi:protein tyrosine/serine phosphatase